MTFSATSIQNGHIPYNPNMQGSGPFAHRNDLKISNAPPLNQPSLSFLDINDGTVGLAYRPGGLVDRIAASFDLNEPSTMRLGAPAWQDQQPHFTPTNATKRRCCLAHSDAMGYAVKAGKGEDIDASMFAGVADGRSGAALRTAGFVLKAAEAKGQDCSALTKALEETMIRLNDPDLSIRDGTTDTQVRTSRFVAAIKRVEREIAILTNALGGNDVVLDHVANTAAHQLLLENLFQAHPTMFTNGEWTVVDGNGNPLKPTGFVNPPSAEVIQAQFNAQHPDGNQADQLCRQIEQLLKIGAAISEEVKDQPAPATTPTPPGTPVTPGQGAGYPSIVNNAAGGTGGNASVNIPPGAFGASQTQSASDEAAVINAKTLQIAVQALSDRLAEALQNVRNSDNGAPRMRSSSFAGSVADLDDDVFDPREAGQTKRTVQTGLPQAMISDGDHLIPVGAAFGDKGEGSASDTLNADLESVIDYPDWTNGQSTAQTRGPLSKILVDRDATASLSPYGNEAYGSKAAFYSSGMNWYVSGDDTSSESGKGGVAPPTTPTQVSKTTVDTQVDDLEDLPANDPPLEPPPSFRDTRATQTDKSAWWTRLKSGDSGYDDSPQSGGSEVDQETRKNFGFVLGELAQTSQGTNKGLRKVEGDLKWQRPKPVESNDPPWLTESKAKTKKVAAEDLPQRWKADFGYPLSPDKSQTPNTSTSSMGIPVNAATVPTDQDADSDMDAVNRSRQVGSDLSGPQASLADQLQTARSNLNKVDPRLRSSFENTSFGRVLEGPASNKGDGRMTTAVGLGQDLLNKRMGDKKAPHFAESDFNNRDRMEMSARPQRVSSRPWYSGQFGPSVRNSWTDVPEQDAAAVENSK